MPKDPDKVRAYNKWYRATHRTEIALKQREYYAKHSEKLRVRARTYCRQWYLANQERVKAYRDSKRDEKAVYNKEYGPKWRTRNVMKRTAYDAAWRAKHPDCRKLEYAKHSEKIKLRNRQLYADNPGPFKARAKEYREANRERLKQAATKWKLKNASKVKAYKDAWTRLNNLVHPEKRKEIAGRRRARKRQTKVERVDLKQVLIDSKGVCGICTKPLDLFGIHFDHIIPLAKGGTHTRDNIQAAHARYNLVKGVRVA